MKKRLLLSMCALYMLNAVHALTLAECMKMARENYPAIKQYDLIAAAKDYDLSNADKGWLPQVSLQAGTYAFTDILHAEDKLAQMGVSMKNYLADGNVTVKQTIYDGGRIAAGKRLIEAKGEVDARQTDVTLYNIKERVMEIYFGILLIDEQLKQNEILQQDLQVSIHTVEDMMRGGIANSTDLDALQVELYGARQQHDAYESLRKAYIKMLGTFVGKDLGSESLLEKPAMATDCSGNASLRPELAYYSAQDNMIEAQRKQLNSAWLPTVGFMGTGLLHTQVTNAVNAGHFFGGLSVSWNIGALYTRKNDLRKLDIKKQQNDVQRQTFLFQNRLKEEETDGNIAALRKQLESDNEIVSLRENIRSKADKKVAAGTESVNELVRDINAVSRARGQKAIHEMQLLKAIYELRNVKGNL